MIDPNTIAFLERINTRELLEKIRRFRSLNIALMTHEAIYKEIYNVLTFEGQFFYFVNMSHYPKGTKFFRARLLDGSIIPNKNLRVESDFWNAPNHVISSYGRLNKPQESLLYTTPIDPQITLREIKVPDDTFYSLIVYEAKKDIKVNPIGQEYDYDLIGLSSEKVKINNDIINDFLKDEFSRDVGAGTEYLYIVSEFIAKTFFDLPPRVVQDAWAYPSMKDKSKYNVCFRPEIAKELLDLKGALLCHKQKNSEDIKVHCIAHGFGENGEAFLHPIGSDVQKEIFPEVSQTPPS